MKCPCINCICIPICRHKPYHKLFESCCLLLEYEPHYLSPAFRTVSKTRMIEETLNSTAWKYEYNIYDNSSVPMVVAIK